MQDSKDENKGVQRKWFVRIDLQYSEKSIFSTDKTFHGLQNGVFKLSVCNDRGTQKCMKQKLSLESVLFSNVTLLCKYEFSVIFLKNYFRGIL